MIFGTGSISLVSVNEHKWMLIKKATNEREPRRLPSGMLDSVIFHHHTILLLITSKQVTSVTVGSG